MSCTREAWGLSYGNALNLVGAVLVAEAAWLHFVHRRVPPGPGRLVAALPFMVFNLIVPRLFCRHADVISIILTGFNTGWLTNFKILAWVLNRGFLSEPVDFTALQFGAILLTPITPQAGPAPPGAVGGGGEARRGGKARLADSAGGPARLAGTWLAKLVLVVVVVWSLGRELPYLLRSFALAMGLYGLLSSIMDGPAALITSAIGIKVSPHFDKPWLSSSVATLWSKRWDLAAGNVLRTLVFEPVSEARAVGDPRAPPRPRAPPAREAAAVATTFATSGAVHEYLFWCITGSTSPRFVWLSFFLSQIPLLLCERLVLGALKRRGVLLPLVLRTAYTLYIEFSLTWYLFWRPTDRAGITQDVVDSVRGMLAAAGGLLGP